MRSTLQLKTGKRVLYTEASKAIYGMVDSAFLFWLYLSSHLAEHGFVMNPYDVCCMNKEINGKQYVQSYGMWMI
jgi:hypothetical protein